jgi:hypothetical protein
MLKTAKKGFYGEIAGKFTSTREKFEEMAKEAGFKLPSKRRLAGETPDPSSPNMKPAPLHADEKEWLGKWVVFEDAGLTYKGQVWCLSFNRGHVWVATNEGSLVETRNHNLVLL